MFIFSAENLSQTYRRLRYVREYADFQRLQAIEIERKQKQVEAKKAELETTRSAKEKLLQESETEKKKLEKQEKDKQQILNGLKRKQRGIQSEINKKRRSANKLNAQIDRLIEQEIEKARKRAEEEAKKKAKAEAAKDGKKAAEKPAVSAKKTETKGTVDKFRMNTEDRQLSGSFEKNKGILPMPITGPYVIVGRYGQYAVTKNVRLDNKGIDIRGKEGAKARAIFDGEVSAIFKYNGLNNVLIRHGNYISVYCNLSTVSVTKGSKVKTRQEIGTVQKDASGNPVLHFQLRKETAKLNPEAWLGR